MPTGVSFSAAHRLAVLPMCQPLICHRALETMSQSLDGAPSRLCRKPGRSAASVPPACPFPFPVQQPHARISGQPPSWKTVFILFCTAVSLLAAPTRPSAPFSFCPPIRPHLPVTSPVPAVPFRGGKRWCGAKKSVSVQGVAVQAVSSRNSETFFEKKASKSLPGRKKVIPLQPQTRSNGVIRPALRSEEEVIEKFTYQAASVRIQRKTNRQGLEEKDRRIKKTTKSLILAQDER